MTRGRRLACAWLLSVLSAALVPGTARAGAYEDYFAAIEGDDAAKVRQLLDRGMDPDTLDPRGQNGLFVALRGGSSKVVQQLLLHPGIRVDAANASGETPLMMAALRANVPVMRTLIERGAQVNRAGWTPLHYAASSPAAAPVELLLKLGAAVDARAPNGNTPLMQAARFGHEDSVGLLLRAGADRTVHNERGYTAAEYARLDGREAVARRLESGAP